MGAVITISFAAAAVFTGLFLYEWLAAGLFHFADLAAAAALWILAMVLSKKSGSYELAETELVLKRPGKEIRIPYEAIQEARPSRKRGAGERMYSRFDQREVHEILYREGGRLCSVLVKENEDFFEALGHLCPGRVHTALDDYLARQFTNH